MTTAPVTRFLCEASIELRAGSPVALGTSPWSTRRIGDIASGHFKGPRLNGRICPSGADWAQPGTGPDGELMIRIDVRSLWETDDGANIYVTYGGRLIVPAAVQADFADAKRLDTLPESRYYFRTNPLFETGSPQYAWLNALVTVGVGRRTSGGVVYRIYEVL
jgi:hypothetical protein